MNKVAQIETEQDILNIVKMLLPIIEQYNLENIEIVDTIPSYYLKKIDEELWKKFIPDRKYSLKTVANEEIKITHGRIKFILKGDGDYGYPVKNDRFDKKYIEEKK